MILGHVYTSLPKFTAAWSGDLETSISEADWQKAFYYTHKSSISSYVREKNYKVLSRWYRVPSALRIMFPSTPDSCWRCNSAVGTYLHIWWDCEAIRPFWNQIFKIYSDIYSKPLLPSPTVALLSILPGTFKFQKHTLLRFCLSTSRQLISRHWRSPLPPSLAEWVTEMNGVMLMEELQAKALDSHAKFSFTWGLWREFSSSDALKALLSPDSSSPPP